MKLNWRAYKKRTTYKSKYALILTYLNNLWISSLDTAILPNQIGILHPCLAGTTAASLAKYVLGFRILDYQYENICMQANSHYNQVYLDIP
jgi:hypothetical protein